MKNLLIIISLLICSLSFGQITTVTNDGKTYIFKGKTNVSIALEDVVIKPDTVKVYQANYYASPNGNDSNPGTIDKPFASLNGVWKVIKAGDLVYLRGGTYAFNTQQRLTGKSGAAGNLIKIWAYPGETPIIIKGSNYTALSGIEFYGNNYIHIKGLEITGFKQSTKGENNKGFAAWNSNNCIFEQINYHHNSFGFLLDNGSNNNLILNCDSHHNYDPYTASPYDNSDGFEIVTTIGTTNTIRGCRSWNNSDDGYDCYRSDGNIIIDKCWAWNNGYREDGMTAGGNGWGFKLGITLSNLNNQVLRTMTNSIAFKNRGGGITQGDANCIMHIFNNTTYSNRGARYTTGISFGEVDGIAHIIRNNISFDEMLTYSVKRGSIHDHNSWNSGVTLTAADFISLNTTGVDGARNFDGSLPVLNFLRLAPGSDLINAGVNLGYGTNIGTY